MVTLACRLKQRKRGNSRNLLLRRRRQRKTIRRKLRRLHPVQRVTKANQRPFLRLILIR